MAIQEITQPSVKPGLPKKAEICQSQLEIEPQKYRQTTIQFVVPATVFKEEQTIDKRPFARGDTDFQTS